MPGTKEDLRAEIATLREELAAERAKVEVLSDYRAAHAGHGCCCTHINYTFTPAPVPWWQQGYTVTCGATELVSPASYGSTSVAASCAGAGLATYTLGLS